MNYCKRCKKEFCGDLFSYVHDKQNLNLQVIEWPGLAVVHNSLKSIVDYSNYRWLLEQTFYSKNPVYFFGYAGNMKLIGVDSGMSDNRSLFVHKCKFHWKIDALEYYWYYCDSYHTKLQVTSWARRQTHLETKRLTELTQPATKYKLDWWNLICQTLRGIRINPL